MKRYRLFFAVLGCFSVNAQVNDSEKTIATQLLQKNSQIIKLTQQELDNSLVSNTYIIPGSEIRMVYLQQSHLGIPVYNKLHVLAFKNENAVSVAGERISSLEQKITGTGYPEIDAPAAVRTALSHVNSPAKQMILPVGVSNGGQRYDFGTLGVS